MTQSSLNQVSEAKILADAMKWLKQQPNLKPLRICDMYNKGYADIFICVNGKFVCAELKRAKGRLTPHQVRFLEDMEKVGAIVGVCRSVEDVRALVERASTK